MNRFEGKVCLITGATKGIGYSIAERIGDEKGIVIICSRRQENVTESMELLKKKNIKCHGIVCNVGKKDERTKLIDFITTKYGKLDVLVPNAAVSTHFGS